MIEVTRNGYGIHVGTSDAKGILLDLTPDEARELIEKLQAALSPPPPATAWMVVPSHPGMPLESGQRSGVNMIPCELWVAEQAVNHSGHADLRTGIFSLGEAFELAWQQRTHETAYIVDHGDGTYTVAL